MTASVLVHLGVSNVVQQHELHLTKADLFFCCLSD